MKRRKAAKSKLKFDSLEHWPASYTKHAFSLFAMFFIAFALVSLIPQVPGGITALAVLEPNAVENPNSPPVWSGSASYAMDPSSELILNLSEHFTDAEGDDMTYLATTAEHVYTNLEGEMLTLTTSENFSAAETISVYASDGTGMTEQEIEIVGSEEEVEVVDVEIEEAAVQAEEETSDIKTETQESMTAQAVSTQEPALSAAAFSGSGSGTLADPYQITTCAQLQEMNDDVGANYTLGGDIDCSGTKTWNDNTTHYLGFEPIYDIGYFRGTFDGINYTVSNLYIYRPANGGIGLFSSLASVGIIKNVGLVDVNITCQGSCGALVGENYGGNISNCYSTGRVEGSFNYVFGGLVGRNEGLISDCYSSVNLNVTDYYGTSRCGGLVGQNEDFINNSYAIGSVNCTGDKCGGLIGNNAGGTVINSFATGSVNSLSIEAGGLIGIESGTIINSYYNNHTGNPDNCTGSGSSSGCTAIQDDESYFYDPLNLPLHSWDFVNIWVKNVSDYPNLKGFAEAAPAPEEPDTTEFDTGYGTTDFSSEPDLTSVEGLVLGTANGKIVFPSSHSINAEGEDYDLNVEIGANFVSVNSSALDSSFNSPANITLQISSEAVTIYYGSGVYSSAAGIISGGSVCTESTNPSCTIVDQTPTSITFQVSHFTGFAIGSSIALTATSSYNLTTDNLTLQYTLASGWHEIISWLRNGIPLTVLNLPFDGGSNSTWARDYSVYSNNATVIGAENTTAGYLGGAYVFDSSSDTIVVPYSSQQMDIKDEITIELWANISGGFDIYGYNVEDNGSDYVNYRWIETPDENATTVYIDQLSSAIDLGFMFNFYGNMHSSFYICQNGLISFSSSFDCEPENRGIPSTLEPHNFIAPWWDDLGSGSTPVKYYMFGRAPSRYMVVTWEDTDHFDYSSGEVTFQAILYEHNGKVKLQYKDAYFGSSTYDYGASATVGFEINRTEGEQYSYNTASISDDMAIQTRYKEPKVLVGKGEDVYQIELAGNNSDMKIYGFIKDNAVNASITPGWHHIVMTYDGIGQRLYIDGNLEDNRTFLGAINSNTANLTIGKNVNATIDNVRIYRKGFSEVQVGLLYQNISDIIPSNETLSGEVWQACVTPNNGTHDGTTNCSNNITIQSLFAFQPNPFINATSINNYTTDNITARNVSLYFNPIRSIISWYNKNNPIMALNFPFEAGSSTSTFTRDYSGNGNNGTVYGAQWKRDAGYIGSAYLFDGVDDYIDLDSGGANPWFDDSFSERTVEARFKADDIYSTQVLYEEGGNTDGINIYIDDAKVYAGAWSETNGWEGEWHSAPIDTEWHHAVLVFDSKNNFDMYLDGQLAGSAQTAGDIAAHTADDAVGGMKDATKLHTGGQSGDGLYYNGLIDELRVYDRALSREQISQLYIDRADVIVHQETRGGDEWRACVTRNDESKDNNTICTNNVTIPNIGIGNVAVTSSTGENFTNEEIIAYYSLTNGSDRVEVSWYKNEEPIMLLNMPFEGNSSGIWTKDYSSFSNDGAVVNATWNRTGGHTGGGYELEPGNFINISHDASLNVEDNSFTLSAWVKLDNHQTITPLIIRKSGGGKFYNLGVDSGNRAYIWVGNQTTRRAKATGTSEINDSKWHHVAGVRSGSTIRIYVDGVQEKTADASSVGSLDNTGELVIGNFSGSIDTVSIYNISLMPQQIYRLYQNGTDRIVSYETSIGDVLGACVTPSDAYEDGAAQCANTTIRNIEAISVVLNTSLGNSYSNENLTLHYNIIGGGRPIITWFKNNASIMALNMPFEGGSNSTFTRDYTIYSNNGTVYGASWNGNGGYYAGGYDFDGNNDYISAGNDSSLNLTGQISASAWINPAQIYEGTNWKRDGQIVGKNGAFYLAINKEGLLTGFIANQTEGAWISAVNMSGHLNEWSHVAMTYDSNTLRLYYNGQEVNSTTVGGLLNTNSNAVTVGWVNESRYFNGTIDEVIIYNYTLTPEQISATYSNAINTTVSQETSRGETWSACVIPNYGEDGIRECSNNLTIVNYPPSHDTPIINTSFGSEHLLTENITVYNQSTFDADNDIVVNIINWYLDNSPITILHMPFEGGSNSTFTKDYSGLGNDGTVVNAYWNSSAGRVGEGAYQFDGSGDYIDLGAAAGVNSSGEGMISAWIKIGSVSTNKTIISFTNGTTEEAFVLGVTDNQNITVYAKDDGDYALRLASQSTVLLNTWVHVIFAVNSSGNTLYINGNPANANYINGSSSTSIFFSDLGLNNLSIGRSNVNDSGKYNYFNGLIDEARIYNKSFSADQIKQIYNGRDDLILSSEIAGGDSWKACITPADLYESGQTKCNTIVISDLVAQNVVLNASFGLNVTFENLTVYYNVSGYREIINWYVDNESLTALNMPFEGGSNSTWTKDYSNSNHGDVNGAEWGASTGYVGGGYDFDGTDSITVPDSASLDIQDEITIEMWVNDPPAEGAGPAIKRAYAAPDDVKPGDVMDIIVNAEDISGIESVTAEAGHDKGVDTLNLELISGDATKGVWKARWDVHDTVEKQYKTKITAENTEGEKATAIIVWTDAVGGPDAFTYSWKDMDEIGVEYDWIEITGGTNIRNIEDTLQGPFPLGFDFMFYGETYDQFYVCQNGYLTFDSAECEWENQDVPDIEDPDNYIAPWWDDFDASQGTITYKTYGIDSRKYTVVTWENMTHYDDKQGNVEFQAILYEEGDRIKFQYKDASFGVSGYDDGESATVAIENDDGTIGLKRSFNSPLLSDSYAVMFSYNRLPNITSVSYLPADPLNGDDLTFSVEWVDLDNHSTNMTICKTSGISGQSCTGGTWCSNYDSEAEGPTACSFTSTGNEVGTNDYYVYVCDFLDCSEASSGTFDVKNKILLGKGRDAYQLEIDDDLIVYGVVNNKVVTTGLETKEWHHVVFTYDGEEQRIYVDGELRNFTSASGSIGTNNENIVIGENILGQIDEVRIYRKAISEEQVKRLYANKTEVIVSDDTLGGETWKACVTPNNGMNDGASACSNNLTLNHPPEHDRPLLNSTSPQNTKDDNLTVHNISTSDYENDPVKNIIDWRADFDSINVLNAPFESRTRRQKTRDYSIFSNDGTVYSASWGMTGYDGKGAYYFDGANDYIDFGKDESLNLDEEVSVEVWMNVSSSVNALSAIPAENWVFARQISISPTTPEADYQVRIRLNTSIFDYSNIKPDGSDIRFYDRNGNKLDYWTEQWNNTGTSVIWVKVAEQGSSAVYMIYNNSAVSSESSGEDTFEFFDEFQNLNQWTVYDQQPYTFYSCGVAATSVEGRSVVKFSKCDMSRISSNEQLSAENISIERMLKGFGGTIDIDDFCGIIAQKQYRVWPYHDNSINKFGGSTGDSLNRQRHGMWNFYSTVRTNNTGEKTTQSGWQRHTVQNTGGVVKSRYSSEAIDIMPSNTLSTGYLQILNDADILGPSDTGERGVYVDWIFVRKYSHDTTTVVGEEILAGYNAMVQKGTSYAMGANTTNVFSRITNGSKSQILNAGIGPGWQHVVMTYDGTSHKLYINGTLASSSTSLKGNLSESAGKLVAGYFFNGTLDEVKVYSRALSAEQVKALYENRTDFVSSEETESYEIWQACITPHDTYQDGETKCSNMIQIDDIFTPVINISAPLNNSVNDTNNTVIFEYYASDGSEIANCSLYINGALNQTNSSLNNFGNNSFTVYLGNDDYTWHINCTDDSYWHWSADSGLYNLELDVDADAPNLTIISPADDHLEAVSHNVPFVYNISDRKGVANCTLKVDGSEYFDDSITNGDENNFTVYLDNGQYYWNLSCVDSSALHNVNTTLTYNLTLDVPPPAVSLNIDAPTTDTNFTQGQFHAMTINVTCTSVSDCDEIKVTLDPSTIYRKKK